MIKIQKFRNKIITGIAALMFSVAAFGGSTERSYADDPTTESGSNTSTEAGSTEEGAVKTDILDDENGRISFWEWERVTKDNIYEKFKDGKFHACMFCYLDSSTTPGVYRFVSLYNDADHIYLPRETVSTGWYNHFDRLAKTLGDEYTAEINKVYGKTIPGSSHPYTYCFDQYSNFFMKLDEDGRGDEDTGINEWILENPNEYVGTIAGYNTTYKSKFKDKFFTTGGCMGVLFVQAKDLSKDKINKAAIAVCDGTAKSNPADMSYLGFGDRASRDHIYLIYNNSGVSGEKGEPCNQLTNYYPWFDDNDFKTHYYSITTQHADGYNGSYWQIVGDGQSNKGWMTVLNGWINPFNFTVKDAGGNLRQRKAEATDEFEIYVGTQHVLASLKGEGGDEVSGEGGITTVGKDQMLIVGDATYIDQNNKPAQAEGVVLPETSKIVVNKGGVLAIDGNFINNGQIICNGGTIIVKDGGCISPYRGTKEGTITINGGDMIIMPGGKVYALTELNNYREELLKYINGYNQEVMDLYFLHPDTLTVINGGNIINYGELAATRTVMDSTGKIEIRQEGSAVMGALIDDNSEMLYHFEISLRKTNSGANNLYVSKNGVVSLGFDDMGDGVSSPGYYNKTHFLYSDTVNNTKGTIIVEKTACYASVWEKVNKIEPSY